MPVSVLARRVVGWPTQLEADPAGVLLQLVPAVTELIIAELLYLQYKDRTKPIFLYINSTGTSRADGETVSRAQSTLH
jgi:ATP-dependent protease ClpP protease subunit